MHTEESSEKGLLTYGICGQAACVHAQALRAELNAARAERVALLAQASELDTYVTAATAGSDVAGVANGEDSVAGGVWTCVYTHLLPAAALATSGCLPVGTPTALVATPLQQPFSWAPQLRMHVAGGGLFLGFNAPGDTNTHAMCLPTPTAATTSKPRLNWGTPAGTAGTQAQGLRCPMPVAGRHALSCRAISA